VNLIEGSDYTIRVIDFPTAAIGGAVVMDDDGHYNIYINGRRSWEAQRISLRHEMKHLLCSDFDGDKRIEDIEK